MTQPTPSNTELQEFEREILSRESIDGLKARREYTLDELDAFEARTEATKRYLLRRITMLNELITEKDSNV